MVPVAEPGLSFADLLRRLRAAARLTQEELAEAAGLSPRSVSDLERGINRTARKDSALLLADALNLTGQARVLFVAAARGRAPAADVLAAEEAEEKATVPGLPQAAATRTLPRDVGSFTGREAELARLLGSLTSAVGVSGGVGEGDGASKRGGVSEAGWVKGGTGVSEGGASGEIGAVSARDGAGGGVGVCAIDGMAGAGKTAFAVHAAHRLAASFPDGQFFVPLHAHAPGQQPVGPDEALASLLLTAGVATQHIPPGLEARAARWRDYAASKKILLLLDDAAGHEQIRPLLPGGAGSLVLITSRRRLTALEDATILSIDTFPAADAADLLARLADRPDLGPDADATWKIAELCGYLPLAIGMLARQLKHHPARTGADLAADLTAARDRLAVMRAENLSVAAAFDLSYRDLTADQQRLFRRLGLAPGPDIDAYAAAALDDISVEAARGRLDELYDHNLITEPVAGRYLLHDLLREYAAALAADDEADDSRTAAGRLVNYYAHVAAAASTYIATWTTAGGRPPPSSPPASVPRLATSAEAVAWLEAERPNLHAAVGFAAEAMPLYAVAIATAMGGFLRAHGHWDQAAAQYQTALRAASRAGDRPGQAGTLDELGLLQQLTADYPAATRTLAQAVALYQDLGDKPSHAYALNHLGLVHQDTGDYRAAGACHQEALALARDANDPLAEAVSRTDLGQVQQLTGDYAAAVESHKQALAMFRDLGSLFDQADALCQLGFAEFLMGDYAASVAYHHEGLELFRRLGDRLGQAWAMSGLADVHLAAGDYQAAAGILNQTLQVNRDLGHRHGEAVTLNSLGELSAKNSAVDEARGYHDQALSITREIGAHPEEARALAGIGMSLLPGSPAEAAGCLRDALAIFRRIGSPAAQRVQETLDEHGL
jgi:tetratricopeptide (TPR) repeat protein/transcriptional regulator with XRE-family HTH domain